MTKSPLEIPKSLQIPKAIVLLAQFLELISTKLATRFAARLFTTPIKHKIPKRELLMDKESVQTKIHVTSINKSVVVYKYGTGQRRILLVHGWSGRGTQLCKIAAELVKKDFEIISFDAPAHGKSKGSQTIMLEFIATIHQIAEIYGPFEAAVGHSLGGMSLLAAVDRGLKINKLVTIGAADKVSDIMIDFVKKLKLKPIQSELLRELFEATYKETMESLSGSVSAKGVTIPVLVIHDQDDAEVSVGCAVQIEMTLSNGQLMITQGLGHRKILGDRGVVAAVSRFIVASLK